MLVVVVVAMVVVVVFVVLQGPFSKTDHVVYARFLEIGVFWKSWLPHVGKTNSFKSIIACRASWGTLRLQVLGWMPETARRKLAVISPWWGGSAGAQDCGIRRVGARFWSGFGLGFGQL